MTEKNIYLVVGLGVTGQALIQYFLEQGISCIGFDELSHDSYQNCIKKFQGSKARFYFRKLPKSVFGSLKKCFVSPGVPLTRPWIQEATKTIPVTGELEFASQLLEGSILAVTGTNGKSTVVTLLHSILSEGGIKASLKGNIGSPLITAVSEPPQDYYVVEISSYQLETIERFHPKISFILNVSEDHLDRYTSFESYAETKARIFMNQQKDDFLIYNADDPHCARLIKKASATCIPFSLVNHQKEGGYLDRNEMVVRLKGEEKRYSCREAALKGLHNQENMLAAILAATLVGVSQENIIRTLNRFKPLRHRLESLGSFKGMTFYDDSKGTNVGSVVMSLASFEENVILILGGKDKGGDYSPLKSLIEHKTKALIIIGEAGKKISTALKGSKPLYCVETMKEGVKKCFDIGNEGDVVLLSPACSSFDQYKNYSEKGEDFKNWVLHYGK